MTPGGRRPPRPARSLANREIGWKGSSLISEWATTGSHSSSRPTRERMIRVLAWPRSPSRITSWPASTAFSSWGSTVSSKPSTPVTRGSPAAIRAEALRRISWATGIDRHPASRRRPSVVMSGGGVSRAVRSSPRPRCIRRSMLLRSGHEPEPTRHDPPRGASGVTDAPARSGGPFRRPDRGAAGSWHYPAEQMSRHCFATRPQEWKDEGPQAFQAAGLARGTARTDR